MIPKNIKFKIKLNNQTNQANQTKPNLPNQPSQTVANDNLQGQMSNQAHQGNNTNLALDGLLRTAIRHSRPGGMREAIK